MATQLPFYQPLRSAAASGRHVIAQKTVLDLPGRCVAVGGFLTFAGVRPTCSLFVWLRGDGKRFRAAASSARAFSVLARRLAGLQAENLRHVLPIAKPRRDGEGNTPMERIAAENYRMESQTLGVIRAMRQALLEMAPP